MDALENTHNYALRWKTVPKNTVFHSSAEALLWRLPRNSIDMFWFSPPYNLDDRFRGGNYQETGIKLQYDGAIQYKGDGTGLPESVYQAQQQLVLALCAEALKKNGVMFYSHKVRLKDGVAVNPRAWIDRSGFHVIQEVIWDRGSTAQGDPRRLYPVYETVYILALKKAIIKDINGSFALKNAGKRSGGPGLTDVWHLPVKTFGISRKESGHPAVAPLELVRKCMEIAPVQKGSIVCDPYCGTGTTGRIAVEFGMYYVLCDAEYKWARHTRDMLQGEPHEMRRLRENGDEEDDNQASLEH